MARHVSRALRKVGLPPGSIVPVEGTKGEKVCVTIIAYDEGDLEEKEVCVEDCSPSMSERAVTWINVSGIHDAEVIEKLGEQFHLHPLLLEDVVSPNQRPKLDDYEDRLFAVLKMLLLDEGEDGIRAEQVSLVLGPGFVISFQEKPGDVFDPIRERIRGAKGRIRSMGADYLAYALIDAVVDHYFVILEKIEEEIDALEDDLESDPGPQVVRSIHELKREMISLRKLVWPIRELISAMQRGGSDLISESTAVYLRDVHDHTIRVVETIESLRDIVSGMLDTYLSVVSNRMNEVMKVLTIIATIFIPITFVAGIYGMNFENMPELKCRLGYPAVWLIMITVVACMLFYFRRKRWI